jgi:hypothetical protein
MPSYKLAVAVATLSIVASSAIAAPKVAGAWKGKLKIDMSKLPKPTDAQQAAMIKQQVAMQQNMVINLNLAANGTFKLTLSGTPMAAQAPTQKGTWKVNGRSLVLTSTDTPSNGKAQTFTFAKDFKSFTFDIPGGMGVAKFTR